MSVTDELLQRNEAYAQQFSTGSLAMPPARNVAVVACMDARLNVYGLLGLKEGEVHVIRNAGGVVTDDMIRSLLISQRLLGTQEIMLIHHTDCGMLTFSDDEVKGAVQADTGLKPPFALEASPTSRPTSASRSPGSRQARSCRTRARSEGSCSTSRQAG